MAHQHRQLCKVTGIVVDLGVHDAPDLHLGSHWQRRLSFQEKQVRFFGKSNEIELHPSKTFKPDFQMHPESNYSIMIFITVIFIRIYSILFFAQFLPKSATVFYFPKPSSLPFVSGNPCHSTWPCPTASSGAGRSRRRNGIPRCRSEVATAAARVAATWQLGVKP